MWLQNLLGELSVRVRKTRVLIDNQPAIHVIKSGESSEYSKHIDVKYKYVRERYIEGRYRVDYIHTSHQKADLLTKALAPRGHREMVSGLDKQLALICVLASMLVVCEGELQIKDLVVWRETKIKHVEDTIDIDLNLMFHDPCISVLQGLTGVPLVDVSVVEVCSKRFKLDLLDTLTGIEQHETRRHSREPITLTTIAAVSAVYATAKTYIKATSNEKSIQALNRLTLNLDAKLASLAEKTIIANDRISANLSALRNDVKLLGIIVEGQPKIDDALFQVLLKLHDEKKRITKLKEDLCIGGEVPPILVEIFNLTNMGDRTVLKNSVVHTCKLDGDELNIRVTLLRLSRGVTVMRPDPFSYKAVQDGALCTFRYVGPDLLMYNHSAGCVRPLVQSEVSDDLVLSEGCRGHRELEESKMFEPFGCQKTNLSKPRVQLKFDGQRLLVNCEGHSIIINGQKRGCMYLALLRTPRLILTT